MMPLAVKMKRIPHHIVSPIRAFFTDSRAGGILLIACTLVSMVLSNIPSTREWWIQLWSTHTGGTGPLHLPESYLLWVNDAFMAIFFFLVGMEIKRELITGELASVRKSLLPVMGALGGMIVPALLFLAFNFGTSYQHGWGIPMATDIAFSLGVLSLLGKKVPVQLKIFLAALAIIDDLGAVITIALFYTAKIHLAYLGSGLIITLLMLLMNRKSVTNSYVYIISGILLWYCLFNSGIHATIAGVVMAFCMPLSKLESWENYLQRPVSFFIMPLFALANTAIVLPAAFNEVVDSGISHGIMTGLILGKPLGIFLFCRVACGLGWASLPSGTSYRQLLGVALLGGIGFTMSIFTSNLAYHNESLLVISKISVILGSIVAAGLGVVYLLRMHKAGKLEPVALNTERHAKQTAERVAYEVSITVA